MRTVEELRELPIAVILDTELGLLVNDAREEEMELLRLIIKERGLEEMYPEVVI